MNAFLANMKGFGSFPAELRGSNVEKKDELINIFTVVGNFPKKSKECKHNLRTPSNYHVLDLQL